MGRCGDPDGDDDKDDDDDLVVEGAPVDGGKVCGTS